MLEPLKLTSLGVLKPLLRTSWCNVGLTFFL